MQAKEEGTNKNRWLLVNVQNVQEFACQVLNRDVWSNAAVKEIISEHFVFWQIYHDSADGQRYRQFYNVQEFPHIAIVDPRTGEKMLSWNSLDAATFCEQVTEFISAHPSPDGSSGAGSFPPTLPQASGSKSRRLEASTLYEQSEEEQLKAAIAASLKEAQRQAGVDVSDDEDDEIISCDSETESNPTSQKKASAAGQASKTTEHWESFIGNDPEKISQLLIRFPDGTREQKSFPADSQLKVRFILFLRADKSVFQFYY